MLIRFCRSFWTHSFIPKSVLYNTDTSNRKVTIAIFVLIAGLIADTILSNSSDLIYNAQVNSSTKLAAFVAILAGVFGAGQFLLLKHLKRVRASLRSDSSLNIIHHIVISAQFILMALFAAIMLEMTLTSQYYLLVIIVVTSVGYTLGGAIMGLLCYRFLSWYRYDKRGIQILLYGLAAGVTACVFITTVIASDSLFLTASNAIIVEMESIVKFPVIDPGLPGILLSVSYLLGIVSLLLVWCASALMLRHHSNRPGQLKYWAIISAPLASVLIALAPDTSGTARHNYIF